MPPQQQQTATPPANPPAPASDEGTQVEPRLDALEAEQQRQGGILEQILQRLPGGRQSAPAGPAEPAGGKSVAELVRDGIAELEARKAREASEQAAADQAADHAARLAALEERAPAELIDTPPGRARAWTQRVVFGIDRPGR
jgi:hypothetical protein